jgi:outer membrane protein assembly factor BamC
MKSSLKRFIILCLSVIFLGACSSVNMDSVLPDKHVEYKREKITDRALEIPPDLTSDRIENRIAGLGSPDGASYTEYAVKRQGQSTGIGTGNSGVLPAIKGVSVVREDQDRWLQIDTPVESVWPKVVSFWQENGILLEQQDPTTGVMTTGWLENTADIKTDFITSYIRGVFSGLYDAGTRDKFRIRLERDNNGEATELYMTHFGMQQSIATTQSGDTEQEVWNVRPRDVQLEAEMLRRLMLYLGVSEAESRAELAAQDQRGVARSQIVKGRDGVSLLIEEPFSRAWRLSGLALDRVGFAVEDRDRSQGVYYVRYNDPTAGSDEGGWLSGLAFWKGDKDIDKQSRYQVQLIAGEQGTRVVINDEQGQRNNSDTGLRILTLMHEQIK